MKSMNANRLRLVGLCAVCVLAAGGLWAAEQGEKKLNLPIAPGPFKPEFESLTQYQCPDWFRDAKFGIWAHWGPQAVPMDGRLVRPQHVRARATASTSTTSRHYGHPSKHGYKDIIPLWKAEKWDPDRLMALYKKAGAKYFVSMGSHHDNFYLWNSKLHRWNAVNMGPQARRRRRLAEGGEEAGPAVRRLRAPRRQLHLVPGQPRGRQDRAARPACPTTAPTRSTRTSITSRPSPATRAGTATIPRWQQQWFDRIKELVDNYQPDLLYTDGGVPFGNEVGPQPDRPSLQRRRRAARRQARGRLHLQAEVRGHAGSRTSSAASCPASAPTRGRPTPPSATGTTTRTGSSAPVSWVIHMLVDIVSKNGNLLLNVVQRPDGSLDPEVEQMLDADGRLDRRSTARRSTARGPGWSTAKARSSAKGGNFKEDFAYTAKDIRFTTKGDDALCHRPGLADGRTGHDPLAGQAAGRDRQESPA